MMKRKPYCEKYTQRNCGTRMRMRIIKTQTVIGRAAAAAAAAAAALNENLKGRGRGRGRGRGIILAVALDTTTSKSKSQSQSQLRHFRLSNPISFPASSMSGTAEEILGETATSTATVDDVLVQYVVLRRDLIDTWPLGSVVTQGCHASVAAIWSHKDDDDQHTQLYCSPSNLDSMHKVTLEVKGETQLTNLSEKLKAAGVLHKLWIEQPENYPTCLATKPYPKSFVSPFFKKLKLCK